MTRTALAALIEALRRLPGVGERSAQRMAYHLLQHDTDAAMRLSAALAEAVQRMRHCARCHTFTESELCSNCADPARDAGLLCVVESPADQAALERSGGFGGYYYVLMGRLDPIGGVGSTELELAGLLERAADGQVREVVLATSFTAEGEATAHVLSHALRERGLRVTRLARGVPAGSELEYVDPGTIAHALVERR